MDVRFNAQLLGAVLIVLIAGAPEAVLQAGVGLVGWFGGLNAAGWTAIATLLMFTATVFLGLIAYRQNNAIHAQMRAYVGFGGGVMHVKPFENEHFKVCAQIDVVNTGQTPAYDVALWIETPVIAPKDANPFQTSPRKEPTAKHIVMGPGQREHINSEEIEIPLENNITSGMQKVFVRGGVNYKDSFGNERYYRFHLKNSDSSGAIRGDVRWLLTAHPPGHRAD